MTVVYDYCPYCEASVELQASEICITLEGPQSRTGTYRWQHDCSGGPIVHKANDRVVAVLLAAGCWVEFTGDEAILETAHRRMAEVKTPADMGFVS